MVQWGVAQARLGQVLVKEEGPAVDGWIVSGTAGHDGGHRSDWW